MSKKDLVIIDNGGANIASVLFAFERLGQKAVLTDNPDQIKKASHVILPGVGAAADAVQTLQAKDGLIDCIRSLTQPVLGICLGMQLLFTRSAEGDVDMLNIIDGAVTKFMPAPDLSIPHMGWNNVSKSRNHALLNGIDEDSYFYFVHSYRADTGAHTIGQCNYNGAFTAVTAQDNVMGCQFHPERSGKNGAKLLENFLSL